MWPISFSTPYENSNMWLLYIHKHLNYHCLNHRQLTVGGDGTLAICSIKARSNLCGLGSTAVSRIPIAALTIILARIIDGAGVPIVAVDATDDPTIDGDDIVEYKVTRTTITAAVATASRNLAIVVNVEVLNRDRSTTVELDDFVRGLECTTSIYVRRAARLLECAFHS